jgi:hypothetical protein
MHHALLVVVGNLDGAYLGPGDQMLQACEEILQEVLCVLLDKGQILLPLRKCEATYAVLTVLAQILFNILLAEEVGNDVVSVDSSFLLLWLLPLRTNQGGLRYLTGP